MKDLGNFLNKGVLHFSIFCVFIGEGRKTMQVCRFKFNRSLSREQIEEKIAFAIVAAECTFGQAKVRLNAAYLAADNKVVIDVFQPGGRAHSGGVHRASY
jgi:hypothetical protein